MWNARLDEPQAEIKIAGRHITNLRYADENESESEVAQSCLTLCDTMDCSLPGSSVRGIFQARILECVAISASGNLPTGIEPASPVSPALQVDSLSTEPSRECVAKVHCPYSFCQLQSVSSVAVMSDSFRPHGL